MSGTVPVEYDGPLHLMEAMGSSFVRSLAACYYAADPTNRRRLREAFADYFSDYERRYQAHMQRVAAAIGNAS